jgi:hypothetical protein
LATVKTLDVRAIIILPPFCRMHQWVFALPTSADLTEVGVKAMMMKPSI